MHLLNYFEYAKAFAGIAHAPPEWPPRPCCAGLRGARVRSCQQQIPVPKHLPEVCPPSLPRYTGADVSSSVLWSRGRHFLYCTNFQGKKLNSDGYFPAFIMFTFLLIQMTDHSKNGEVISIPRRLTPENPSKTVDKIHFFRQIEKACLWHFSFKWEFYFIINVKL